MAQPALVAAPPRDDLTSRANSVFVIAVIALVAAVMGIEYWAEDFYYSFTIKIPTMGLLISLPTLPEIAESYRANHVVKVHPPPR